MNKRGDIEIDYLGKVLIAIIILAVLVLATWLLRDKLYTVFENFKNIMRFS